MRNNVNFVFGGGVLLVLPQASGWLPVGIES